MMFKIDSDGFLTTRSDELEAEIYALHHDLFTGARQINHDCHELLFSSSIRNRDVHAIIVATLFMRAMEHYQAVFILLGRGLIASARVSLRALVETIFKTRAISIDHDALRIFITEGLVYRERLIKKIRSSTYFNLEEISEIIPDEMVKDLKQNIQSIGAKARTTGDWSKLAGMHDWYTTNYTLLSKAVHTEVDELEAYLDLGESGEIEQFHYAPSMEEIPLLILTAAHCLLIGASAFDKTFEMAFGLKGDQHSKFVEAGFRALDEEVS